MTNRWIRCGLSCLAFLWMAPGVEAALWQKATYSESQTFGGLHPVQVQSGHLFAQAAPVGLEAQAIGNQSDETGSRSEQSARLNRNLLTGAVTILTLFVAFRLLLVWQIARNRKKLAIGMLEGES